MRTSGSFKHDERISGAGRQSRWDRIRRRNPVVLPAMVASAWALLVAMFASVAQLLGPEADRGTWTNVLGAVIGNFVLAFLVTLAVTAIVRARRRTPDDSV